MLVLRVGDPHIKPSNLKESHSLLQFILDKALKHKVDRVELLGDLFDTHSIVRLEVLEFWENWLQVFGKEKFKTIVLVGNHDVSGDYSSSYSALCALKRENSNVVIVDKPYVDEFIGYLPYIHSDQEFINKAKTVADLGAKVLVSHPNFKGAVYDNGTPIQNGVDQDDIDSRLIHLIGGHIHTELEYGRVWYTGNPRWMTKSCANKRKGIWLCLHSNETGVIEAKEFISTESVCTPIVSVIWKEGELQPEIPKGAKVNVELVGSSDWVTKQKIELKGEVSISSKITDTKKSKARKSGKSLYEFLSQHYQVEPEKRQKLIKYLGDLNLV